MSEGFDVGFSRAIRVLGRCFVVGVVLVTALLASAVHADTPEPLPLEAYSRLPAIAHPALSPSGERYAYIGDVDGGRHLIVRAFDGELLTFSDLRDMKVRDVDWAGERFVVVTVSQTVNLGWFHGFKHEFAQVLAFDLESLEMRRLLKGRRVLDSAFGNFGYARRDGEWHAFLGALPISRSTFTGRVYIESAKPSLVMESLESDRRRTLDRGRRPEAGWLVGPDGTVLAEEWYDKVEGEWHLAAGRDERLRIEDTDDPFGSHRIVGRGRSPGTVLYLLFDDEQGTRYMEAPLDGGAPVEILADERVSCFHFDPVSGLLIGFEREGDRPETVLFDPAHRARMDATRRGFPDRDVRLAGSASGFERLLVGTHGEGDSGSWYLVDMASGSGRVIGHAYPRVRGEHVAPMRMVEYEASDGLTLHGVLTLPPGRAEEDLPVVVLPHGGPSARDYPRFDWLAQAFAGRGYAVWQPNFRGSSGYGLAFHNAAHGEWGRRMQTDISDGVAALAKRGIVDPDRACIVGASYGGYAALAGVTLQWGLYRCAVAVNGVSDLARFLESLRGDRRLAAWRQIKRLLGVESESDASLDERSPAHLAARADAPVLLIHGENDVVVSDGQSEIMHEALEEAGKPVEMVVLEGEDHWLSRQATRTRMLREAVGFVERHVPAIEVDAVAR